VKPFGTGRPASPPTVALPAALLPVAVLGVAWIRARQTARIDPMPALREE